MSGTDGAIGRRVAGSVAATAWAGITVPVLAAWAFMAAARVAGIFRGCCGAGAAMEGCAKANEDKTTAGSAAVVAAMTGMLMVRFGERGVVMKVSSSQQRGDCLRCCQCYQCY